MYLRRSGPERLPGLLMRGAPRPSPLGWRVCSQLGSGLDKTLIQVEPMIWLLATNRPAFCAITTWTLCGPMVVPAVQTPNPGEYNRTCPASVPAANPSCHEVIDRGSEPSAVATISQVRGFDRHQNLPEPEAAMGPIRGRKTPLEKPSPDPVGSDVAPSSETISASSEEVERAITSSLPSGMSPPKY